VHPAGADSGPPLRVLHLVVLRFWSAIAWHAVMTALALQQRGHACWLGGQAGTPVLVEARQAGVALAAGLELPRLRPWTWGPCVGRLRRFLASGGIDVAFVHTGAGQMELAAARVGLPVANVRVRADARTPRASAWQRWSYAHAVERVAVTGQHMIAGQLGQLHLPAHRVVHLPPAIDCAAIENDRDLARETARAEIARRHGLPADRPWLGIIGRLSPVKGHRVFLEAAGLLAHRGLDFRMLIVGTECEVGIAQLAARAAELGLAERLVFAGHVADPLRYAAALDIGIIASLGSEAVSRSALEFMATGVPVVASRVGILPEVVAHAEQLVAPGDPAALAAALVPLLERPEIARDWGVAGRRRAREHYSLAVLGAGAENLARAALAERRGVPAAD
jgi:glycosyltransferase involved in cell wall biosynthesis